MPADRSSLLQLEQSLARTERTFRARLEVRSSTDGDTQTLSFDGYASTTDTPYELYGGPPYGWTEIIARGAFRKTLSENPDVELLINHGGLPLARTKSGTLQLTEDDIGLRAVAQLDPDDPDVQRIAPKMARRDLDEMSFAFWVVRQRWEDENGEEAEPMTAPVRRILEVKLDRGDVSIVNYGANPTTFADLRDLDRALAEVRAGRDLDPDAAAALRRAVNALVPETEDEPPAQPATGPSLLAARAAMAPSRRHTAA